MRKQRLATLEQRSGWYCPHCDKALQKQTIDLSVLPHLDGRQLDAGVGEDVRGLLAARNQQIDHGLTQIAYREAWNEFVADTLKQIGVPDGEIEQMVAEESIPARQECDGPLPAR